MDIFRKWMNLEWRYRFNGYDCMEIFQALWIKFTREIETRSFLFLAVPVSRRLSRHPAFLDYIIRLFVWAGILLPPPLALIVLLLQLDLGLTIMTFIISKFPKIDTFTASLSFGTTLVQFLVRYIFLLLGIIDIFRCFILVALVSFIGIQLLKNLIDLADGYLDGGVLRQSDFKVYRTVGIIYRIPVLINKFGTFIAIMFLGASSVFFSYIVIRLNPIIPAAFLFLGGLGVLITVFVQMLVCNFGVHINEMSKNLLDKYNRGLGNVGDARKRREMARWVKSLEPLALYVGVGEVTLFILEKQRKVFVFKQMLDYAMETIMA